MSEQLVRVGIETN